MLQDKLSDFRKAAGLSQEKLSEAANVPREVISRIENGRVIPTITTCRKLAQALGVKTGELIDQDTEDAG